MVHSHSDKQTKRSRNFVFPRMTLSLSTQPDSVEICKQLSSLNFIIVKLNSKQNVKWKVLECAIY